MKTLRSLRIVILTMVVALIPATSFGGVFISVNFAPPVLPVYVQPPCPEPGWIWIPGYWAYDEDGYYWVPGTWVPAPYTGALWTPPYWGWDDGLYIFHPGYWGLHVGYYGGVNYGFGYMGIGYVGGMWRGNAFIYNTAITHVDRRYIRNVYEDRDEVRRYTIVNDRRVSFSGGRDGIRHDPLPMERYADRDRHMGETQFQQSHDNAARSDRSFYARNNGGRPSNAVVQRPMGAGPNGRPDNRGGFQGRNNGNQQQYQGSPSNRGPYQDPRSNARGYDNRNTYNPPANVNNQNRSYNNPRQDNPQSNARGYDNRNTYNPPGNVNNQNRGYSNPGNQYRNNNPQQGNQSPQYRNSAPQQYNPGPQFRNDNTPHGGQDNMQNRGGGPPRQQPQQPPQQRGEQGGGRGNGHGR